MGNIGLVLSVLEKIYAVFRYFIWRNKDIVYVNANVKNANLEEIRHLRFVRSDSKFINCQSQKRTGIKALKKHFRKMRLALFRIQRNAKNISTMAYSGFASQMFSVYDGYILGNALQYELVDFNEKYYSVSFSVKGKIGEQTAKIQLEGKDIKQCEEVDLIISTSYSVDATKCKNISQYVINDKAPAVITNKYLNQIYAKVKDFLDSCGNSNVKRVNLYITAKSSVSFVIGTAIQQYHPAVSIYEYRDNSFKYYMDLSKGKIFEVKE